MCLDKNYSKLDPVSLIETGWKEFAGSKSKPEFAVMCLNDSKLVPLDQWITAKGGHVNTGIIGGYRAGFHIYIDPKESGSAKRRRVYFRNAYVEGSQSGHKCVVAKEMYVPSDPEGWPPQ